MRRSPRSVRLDFVAPVHPAPRTAAVLCLTGVTAVIALGLAFRRELAERSRLEAALAGAIPPRRSAPAPVSPQVAAEAAAVARELSTPWTRLLAELEAASHDCGATVALLRVEPDAGKRRVRITAEVRELPAALAYLRRLQRSEVLQNPMLESHERRKDDPDHPLRVQLSAEWRT